MCVREIYNYVKRLYGRYISRHAGLRSKCQIIFVLRQIKIFSPFKLMRNSGMFLASSFLPDFL